MNLSTNRRNALFVALTTSALLAACGGGGGGGEDAAPATPVFGQNGSVDVNTVSMDAGQTCNVARFPQEILAAINAARAAGQNCGGTNMAPAGPLTWNVLIAAASAKHSSDMATNGFFAHTGSDGSAGFERMSNTGYRYNYNSEILNRSTGGDMSKVVSRSVSGFLSSPPHCQALMQPDFKEMGAACVRSGSNAYTTVNFGG